MNLLESMIAVVAPPHCVGCGVEGTNLCNRCMNAKIMYFGERCVGCNMLSLGARTCRNCRARGLPSHVWVAASYQGPAQRLVHKYKFDHSRSVAVSIADLMLGSLPVGINLEDFVVVHIPTATTRVRERGFDHCRLLARQISEQLGLEKLDALGRLGQDTQVGANRSQRISKSASQYYVKNRRAVFAKKVLLVDDIVTTGATLTAATRVLRQASAVEINALIFAKRII